MSTKQIKQLWEKNFGKAPDSEVLSMMGEFTARSEDNERVFVWLLLKSSAQLFASEDERGLWIGQRVQLHTNGGPLPAWKETAQDGDERSELRG
jgi:hypothetical protein